jgi:hypothetical protein
LAKAVHLSIILKHQMVVQVFKTAVVMQADQELFLLQDVVQEQLVVEAQVV